MRCVVAKPVKGSLATIELNVKYSSNRLNGNLSLFALKSKVHVALALISGGID
jgi:hypothetical protein